jgi:hypothetical protein
MPKELECELYEQKYHSVLLNQIINNLDHQGATEVQQRKGGLLISFIFQVLGTEGLSVSVRAEKLL